MHQLIACAQNAPHCVDAHEFDNAIYRRCEHTVVQQTLAFVQLELVGRYVFLQANHILLGILQIFVLDAGNAALSFMHLTLRAHQLQLADIASF